MGDRDTNSAQDHAAALSVARRVMGATPPSALSIGGREVSVTAYRGDTPSWPERAPAPLVESTDGPWPAPWMVTCTASDGSEAPLRLILAVQAYRPTPEKRTIALAVSVVGTGRELVWVTLTGRVRAPSPDTPAVVPGACTVNRRRDDDPAELAQLAAALVQDARATDLRFVAPKTVALFEVDAAGAVLPDASEAIRRLLTLAVVKAPYLARTVSKIVTLVRFPGPVTQMRATLERLLGWLGASGRSEDEWEAYLRREFEVTSDKSPEYYRRFLTRTGFVDWTNKRLYLSPAGARYLAQPSSASLFEVLRTHWEGMLEVLVALEERRPVMPTLQRLLQVNWSTDQQLHRRRDWLRSLGLVRLDGAGQTLTGAGRQLLAQYSAEVTMIRERLTAAGPAFLRPDDVQPHLEGLALPSGVLLRACAALACGKHLLLVGPPGTGKTELAIALSRAGADRGHCAGALVTTASADWTTFDTIGGYALTRDNQLAFREGLFLRAVATDRWLLIDELNRADVDRAFGELMTVMSGKDSQTPFTDAEGRPISVGYSEGLSHRVRADFRVIATMNTWDKTSLFRLSYAVQRRFALIHVGVPDDQALADLVARAARSGSVAAPPLSDELQHRIARLFSREALIGQRAVGPAVLLDVVRYTRERGGSVDGLAEAIELFVLPQLEGLSSQAGVQIQGDLAAAIRGATELGGAALTERVQSLFPHWEL